MPIEKYKLERDIICEQYGKAFLLPRGSECHYFEQADCYLFEAQNGYVPYFERSTVEKFPQFFGPVDGLTQPAADGTTPCAHDFAVTDDVFNYCIHCGAKRPCY